MIYVINDICQRTSFGTKFVCCLQYSYAIQNSGIVIGLEIIYSWQNQATLQYLINKYLFLFYIMIFISTIFIFLFFFVIFYYFGYFFLKITNFLILLTKNLKVINQLLLLKYFVYVIIGTFINFILKYGLNVINSVLQENFDSHIANMSY